MNQQRKSAQKKANTHTNKKKTKTTTHTKKSRDLFFYILKNFIKKSNGSHNMYAKYGKKRE